MEAIKPRQIINYDAGIVLIDLHQQRKNNFRQYKSATLNTGQPHVNEEQNRRTTTHATSAFLTKWLNKLTSLLSKKGPGISQPGSLKPAVGDNVKKKAYTSIKSDEEWTSRVLPSEQDDIVSA